MDKFQQILKEWRQMKKDSAADMEYLLSSFKVIFAYHSGRIENEEITYHTTLEIFEGKPISNFNGDYRTMYEIVNQKDCYNYLLESIVQKAPLTIELIKGVQYELTKQTYDPIRMAKGERPGEFKKGFYVVGEYQVGSPPERVQKDLEGLLDEVNGFTGENLMTTAAYFHTVFERIHPFADGNGRTGRTMLNYLLMTHQYPPIIIRYENRKEYVAAFDKFHYDADLEPMIEYLKKEAVETWKHLLREKQPPQKKLDDFELIL